MSKFDVKDARAALLQPCSYEGIAKRLLAACDYIAPLEARTGTLEREENALRGAYSAVLHQRQELESRIAKLERVRDAATKLLANKGFGGNAAYQQARDDMSVALAACDEVPHA